MTELTDFLTAAGRTREAALPWIDPVKVESSYDRMWRGLLGTYEATMPNDPTDVEVAVRVTRSIEGRVLGDHPDLGRRIATHDSQPITEIALTVVGPWQFHATPE